MSSGGGVSKMLSAGLPEKNYDFWHAVMERCSCADLEAFRALPAEKLYEVFKTAKKEIKGGAMAISPVLDGELVVGKGVDILKAKTHMPISYMVGSTSEDMMPPILYKMGLDWCAAQEAKSYAWFFNRQLPGDDNGAWHSSDLWYWFGTLDNCWRPMEKKDHDISRQMVSYLMNFCTYGDPNGAGLTAWLPAGQKALCIGEGATHMGKPSMPKLIKTMLTNKAVGE